MKILLIEDEPEVASLIERSLNEYGHIVHTISNGREGIANVQKGAFDIIILDVMLPDITGWKVCKEIRSINQRIPILMLTALNSLENIVQGLELGADDYLAKPFRIKELVARLQALHRRNDLPTIHEDILEYEDILVNLEEQTVKRAGNPIKLTTKEFFLLVYFMRNPRRVLSRNSILENVWGIDFDPETNVVDVFVNYLRNKIDKPYQEKLIHTVFGIGYVLKKEA
ncbi:MAG: response regulator transcription factor [Bacteroidota bacterium]